MWVRRDDRPALTIRALEVQHRRDALSRRLRAHRRPPIAQLVGANLLQRLPQALHDALGGVHGCTHLTELLGYLPTAAVQTFAG